MWGPLIPPILYSPNSSIYPEKGLALSRINDTYFNTITNNQVCNLYLLCIIKYIIKHHFIINQGIKPWKWQEATLRQHPESGRLVTKSLTSLGLFAFLFHFLQVSLDRSVLIIYCIWICTVLYTE